MSVANRILNFQGIFSSVLRSKINTFFFQAYNVLGLYYGFGRTFFNPASVSFRLLCRIYFKRIIRMSNTHTHTHIYFTLKNDISGKGIVEI